MFEKKPFSVQNTLTDPEEGSLFKGNFFSINKLHTIISSNKCVKIGWFFFFFKFRTTDLNLFLMAKTKIDILSKDSIPAFGVNFTEAIIKNMFVSPNPTLNLEVG